MKSSLSHSSFSSLNASCDETVMSDVDLYAVIERRVEPKPSRDLPDDDELRRRRRKRREKELANRPESAPIQSREVNGHRHNIQDRLNRSRSSTGPSTTKPSTSSSRTVNAGVSFPSVEKPKAAASNQMCNHYKPSRSPSPENAPPRMMQSVPHSKREKKQQKNSNQEWQRSEECSRNDHAAHPIRASGMERKYDGLADLKRSVQNELLAKRPVYSSTERRERRRSNEQEKYTNPKVQARTDRETHGQAYIKRSMQKELLAKQRQAASMKNSVPPMKEERVYQQYTMVLDELKDDTRSRNKYRGLSRRNSNQSENSEGSKTSGGSLNASNTSQGSQRRSATCLHHRGRSGSPSLRQIHRNRSHSPSEQPKERSSQIYRGQNVHRSISPSMDGAKSRISRDRSSTQSRSPSRQRRQLDGHYSRRRSQSPSAQDRSYVSPAAGAMKNRMRSQSPSGRAAAHSTRVENRRGSQSPSGHRAPHRNRACPSSAAAGSASRTRGAGDKDSPSSTRGSPRPLRTNPADAKTPLHPRHSTATVQSRRPGRGSQWLGADSRVLILGNRIFVCTQPAFLQHVTSSSTNSIVGE